MRYAMLLFVVLATLADCATTSPGRPATTTPAALITMPDVVGENAAVAVDEMEALGFTDIDLGTTDGHRMIILPQNWTVTTQSAKPGERLRADTKIVLGCARIGPTRAAVARAATGPQYPDSAGPTPLTVAPTPCSH